MRFKMIKAALVLLLGLVLAVVSAFSKPIKGTNNPVRTGKEVPLSFRSLPTGCFKQVSCAMGSAEKNKLDALVQAMRSSLNRGFTSIKVVSIETNKHCCTLVYSCVNT